jgi:predicted SAM-dependent methyltransferase
MVTRLEKVLSCIDVSKETGLEVGALMNPCVTRDTGRVYYIDHATTEELRSKYANDPNVDVQKIIEVDYVWGEESLPELVGKDAPFDYLIASHVIEHVPDFIGWLKEVHSVLKVGGILSLVIPDKRYCFDYYRQVTRTSDIVEAFLNHARQPTLRQVFDCHASAVSYQGNIAWNCNSNVEEKQLQQIHSEVEAWGMANQLILNPQYMDTHCWVFTPYSFFDLLKSLINLELFDFKVEKFYEPHGSEFYVSLKALDVKELAASDRQTIQLESLSHLSLPQLSSEPSTTTQKRRIQKLEQELNAANNRIKAMETSKFWKIRQRWFKVKQTLGIPTNEE